MWDFSILRSGTDGTFLDPLPRVGPRPRVRDGHTDGNAFQSRWGARGARGSKAWAKEVDRHFRVCVDPLTLPFDKRERPGRWRKQSRARRNRNAASAPTLHSKMYSPADSDFCIEMKALARRKSAQGGSALCRSETGSSNDPSKHRVGRYTVLAISRAPRLAR